MSKTLYYQHKKLYYSADTQLWTKNADADKPHDSNEEKEPDFTFSDQEDIELEEDDLLQNDNDGEPDVSNTSDGIDDFDFSSDQVSIHTYII